MTLPLLRVARPVARVSQPGSSWAPLAKPLDIGVLYSGIAGGTQRNGSHPSYVATNAYGYWEQYPTGTTYASGFWLSQAKPMYAGLGSSFLWHGRITAHSASYPYVAGKWQTPSVSSNNAGQFYLMISASGNIGVTVHRGASGVSTLYTSIQAQLGVPITVLLNFSNLGIDVITSKGREFLSLTGIGGLGSAVAAFGVTVGAPGAGFSGHQYARTGLMVWSDKTLPDDVVKNPWQVFAPVDRKLFLPLSVGGAQVISSITLGYNIKTTVSADSSVTYSVLSATSVSNSLSANFNVQASVQSSSTANYALLNSTQSSASVSYTTKAGIQSSAAVAYNIRTLLTKDFAANYTTFNSVQASSVGAYSIRNSVLNSYSASYTVTGVAYIDRAVSYTVLNSVQRDAAIAYAVMSSTSVANNIALAYNVIGKLDNSVSVAYGINSNVAQSSVFSYNLRNSLLNSFSAAYYTRNYCTSDKAAAYNVRAIVFNDVSASFVLNNSVALSINFDYVLRNSIYRDIAANYTSTNYVNASKVINYFVDGVTGAYPQKQSVALQSKFTKRCGGAATLNKTATFRSDFN